MTEEDEEFERIATAQRRQTFLNAYKPSLREPRWRDHTQWVNLTYEEIFEAYKFIDQKIDPYEVISAKKLVAFANALEDKLKEKNNG